MPLKCTRWTPFSSTTLRVQPLSRCFLNLGGTPFSESSHFQVANGLWFWAWLPTLFSFSVIQDIFIPQFPSIFGATFPLRCSPSLVSVPISSSFLWRVRIFVQHGTFLSAPAAFFSEHTSQSHASWILLSLQGRIPLLKGYLHIVFHRPIFYLSANRISSLLACPIPKHFSGFCLSPELFCLCSGYTDFPCAGGGLKSRSASAPRAGFKVETISLINHRTLNPRGGLLHRRPKILFGCILFSPLLYLLVLENKNKQNSQISPALLLACKLLPYIGFITIFYEENMSFGGIPWILFLFLSLGCRWGNGYFSLPVILLSVFTPNPDFKICKYLGPPVS